MLEENISQSSFPNVELIESLTGDVLILRTDSLGPVIFFLAELFNYYLTNYLILDIIYFSPFLS